MPTELRKIAAHCFKNRIIVGEEQNVPQGGMFLQSPGKKRWLIKFHFGNLVAAAYLCGCIVWGKRKFFNPFSHGFFGLRIESPQHRRHFLKHLDIVSLYAQLRKRYTLAHLVGRNVGSGQRGNAIGPETLHAAQAVVKERFQFPLQQVCRRHIGIKPAQFAETLQRMYVVARMESLVHFLAKGHEIISPTLVPTEIGTGTVKPQLNFVFQAKYHGMNQIFVLGKEPRIYSGAKHKHPAVSLVHFAVFRRQFIGFPTCNHSFGLGMKLISFVSNHASATLVATYSASMAYTSPPRRGLKKQRTTG